MTPQPQTTPAGTGHDHAWVSGRAARAGVTRRAVGAVRDPDPTVYSTDAPPPEPERKLLCRGGEGGKQERRLNGLRVWSEKRQATLPIDNETLTWFARHLAEAEADREEFDADNGGHPSDPGYLLSRPAADFAMFELALKRAKDSILQEQAEHKEGIDRAGSSV